MGHILRTCNNTPAVHSKASKISKESLDLTIPSLGELVYAPNRRLAGEVKEVLLGVLNRLELLFGFERPKVTGFVGGGCFPPIRRSTE
jgi:hypothetical protein